MSLYGLLMSALGGAAIGLVMVIDLTIERTCFGTGWAAEMVLFGTAAGFLGSMVSEGLNQIEPSGTVPGPSAVLVADLRWTQCWAQRCKRRCTPSRTAVY